MERFINPHSEFRALAIQPEMKIQLENVVRLHAENSAKGHVKVYLPTALVRKNPQAVKDLKWK